MVKPKPLELISEAFVASRPSKSGDWVEFVPENPRRSKLKPLWIENTIATDAFGMISYEADKETAILVNVSSMQM